MPGPKQQGSQLNTLVGGVLHTKCKDLSLVTHRTHPVGQAIMPAMPAAPHFSTIQNDCFGWLPDSVLYHQFRLN